MNVSGLTSVRSRPWIAARDDRAGVLRPALARPAGLVGETVEDHPADVVARLRVLVARVAQADDDLHGSSASDRRAEHAEGARSRPGGPAPMVARSPTRRPTAPSGVLGQALRPIGGDDRPVPHPREAPTLGTHGNLRRRVRNAPARRRHRRAPRAELTCRRPPDGDRPHDPAPDRHRARRGSPGVPRRATTRPPLGCGPSRRSSSRSDSPGRSSATCSPASSASTSSRSSPSAARSSSGSASPRSVIAVMLATGESLERYAQGRAHRELSALLGRAPRTVQRYVDGRARDRRPSTPSSSATGC